MRQRLRLSDRVGRPFLLKRSVLSWARMADGIIVLGVHGLRDGGIMAIFGLRSVVDVVSGSWQFVVSV